MRFGSGLLVLLVLVVFGAADAVACIDSVEFHGVVFDTSDVSSSAACFEDVDEVEVPYVVSTPSGDVEVLGAGSTISGPPTTVYVHFVGVFVSGGAKATAGLVTHSPPALPFKIASGSYPRTVFVSRAVNPVLCEVREIEFDPPNSQTTTVESCTW